MFRKGKELVKKLKEAEKNLEKYRIKHTVEKAKNLNLSFKLEPFSKYKLRVYGENSIGKALTSGGVGAEKVVSVEPIYVVGEFTIWVDGKKYDTFKFNKSGTSSELTRTVIQGSKLYDFKPTEETEITIEGTRYKGKHLGVEIFKDIPEHIELDVEEEMEQAKDYTKNLMRQLKILLTIAAIVLTGLIVTFIILIAI
ncbi:MAG: hypothetical protein ACQERB_04910 [Promethearchaeati archaeon]